MARGQTVFAEAGCASCHAGPRHTDNRVHRVFGLRVNTPPLVGVGATAPSLHDGRAPTLRAVLESLDDGGMGSVAGVSDADLDPLEAYLGSL